MDPEKLAGSSVREDLQPGQPTERSISCQITSRVAAAR